MNINKNLKDTMPKFHLSNLNTNKILLGNNKSYISFNTFFTLDIKIINKRNTVFISVFLPK